MPSHPSLPITVVPAAQDLRRRFDELLDHLPAGVIVHDSDGRIVSANRIACELLELSEAELLGMVGMARWHFLREDGSAMSPPEYPANRVLASGAKLSDLVLGLRSEVSGEQRWLISNAYPEHGVDGELERVVVCFTDCTAMKAAQRSAQKAEERLRLAVRGSTDGCWDWDLGTGETYFSERWLEMLGYAPGELQTAPDLWRQLSHPDDLARLSGFVAELLGGPDERYHVEFRLRHKDGHYVPLLARGYVLRDGQGAALRLSGTTTDLTERKRTERQIYELAYFDPLTGLPNRRFLIEQLGVSLARCKRMGRHGALLFIDLDNFKLLNDTIGHDTGDMLLRQVAQRLRVTLRATDHLARLGGDEFVVVLEELGASPCDAAAEARRVASKILAVLGQPYQLEGHHAGSTPSIGITMFDSEPVGIETLLKQADLAMYRAKAEGRNTARFFEPSMQSAADRQAALEHALRSGLAEQQFIVYCQPQFARDGRLLGAEALVRWDRGELGIVPPGEFIGVAEASGLIVPLGRHVLEQSCMLLARWARDPKLRAIRLAVNVSVHQLREPDFPETVAEVLGATGAPPHLLTLEITESVFAENLPEIIERMHRLRDLGVQFSLDDFGTGYSSLAYLMRFPLTALKIDRSFVQDAHADPSAAVIVEAIVGLAHKLGLITVAEGVEEEGQRAFLVDRGCEALQGYLLGRPIPAADFEQRFGMP